jgi:hypothetical protein
MNNLIAWFKAQHWSTHAILLAFGTAATIIYTDPSAKQLVLTFFKNNPDLGTTIITLAGFYVTLKSPHSDAGTLAKANAILDKPDAPTAAQVDAATTK